MPRRDDDEDVDDLRPRRRSRDDDDEDDDRPRKKKRRREEPKSNTGLILGIVGGVVLLVLVGCGFGIWRITQGVNKAVQQAKQQMDEFDAEDDAETVAYQFLDHLRMNEVMLAYDTTTPAFKAKYTRPQFDDLLKKNPLLTTHKDHEEVGVSKVTGAKPTRQRRMQVSLSPTVIDDGFDEDFDDNPRPRPKSKQGAGKRLNVTLTVVEMPDGGWKVDALTIP